MLRWAGVLLYRARLHRVVIWLNRHEPKVLLYHACEATESDFIRGLQSNTPPECFAAHLALLERCYEVIPLERLEAGDIPERAVVITFDDGYRSAYTGAFPALRSRGLAATMYLVTDVVDNGALVWVNELSWLLRRHAAAAVPRATQAFALPADTPPEWIVDHARARFDRELITALLAEIRRAAGVDALALARAAELYVTWREVAEMARSGITFGNHTSRHPNLARLPEAAQRAEIGAAQAVLAAHPGSCRSLAYPFGDHDERARRSALELGITSLMEVGGVNRPLVLDRVARVPIADWSPAVLFAELELVTPLKAWLRRFAGR